MKFKVFIVSVFFICCLLPGISLAQNKVVVIPLWSDSGNEIPTVTSAGQEWMDRNLGALRVATKSADPDAYGSLYQWGRLTDGHEYRASPKISTQSFTDVPGHGDFITGSASPWDWMVQQNNNLWQGASGINNPCPAGFRLPTQTEWENEILSWSNYNSAGAFASPLKLVAAGLRIHSDGTVINTRGFGVYWSSTISGSDARALFLSLTSAGMVSDNRAIGFSVRCIKD